MKLHKQTVALRTSSYALHNLLVLFFWNINKVIASWWRTKRGTSWPKLKQHVWLCTCPLPQSRYFRTQRRTRWQQESAVPREVVPPPWEGAFLSASYIQRAVGVVEKEAQRDFWCLLRARCPVNQPPCLTKPFKAYHPKKACANALAQWFFSFI